VNVEALANWELLLQITKIILHSNNLTVVPVDKGKTIVVENDTYEDKLNAFLTTNPIN
jgi:hypothetical protein